jgi:hypothetical protein
VLRKIFRPKRENLKGDWRKLDSEDFYDLHSSTNIILATKRKRIRWVGHVACMGVGEVHAGCLVRKSEGRSPLARPRHRMGRCRMGGCGLD